MQRRGGTGGRTRPVTAQRDQARPDADTTGQVGVWHAPGGVDRDFTVLAEDLIHVEASESFQDDEAARAAAEALERREGDRRLRDELVRNNYSGRVWEEFEIELVRYGLAVVNAWLLTGEMFRQCHRKKCRPGLPPDVWDDADRESVANFTVAQAVKDFLDKALRQGRWQPEGGASLKTYFIGACVFAFPNAYRAVQNQFAQVVTALLAGGSDALASFSDTDTHVVRDDPQDIVIATAMVRSAFNTVEDDRTKKVILTRDLRYTPAEIAELFDDVPSAGAANQVMHRHRTSLAKAHKPGDTKKTDTSHRRSR